MNPTLIEWVLNPDGSPGFTSNPFTGCLGPNNDGIRCSYCYAWRESLGRCRHADLRAFPIPGLGHNDDPFYPRFHPERLDQIRDRQKPTGIFLCDRSDFAAPYWPRDWQAQLWDMILDCPQHRFYLLTHQPQELPKWSPFPPNCWVGVTVIDNMTLHHAEHYLGQVQATKRFISIEPLVQWGAGGALPCFEANNYRPWLDWLIVGAMTGKRNELMQLSNRHYPDLTLMPYGRIWTLQPKLEWILEIADAATKAHIPLFLKNNLLPLIIDSPVPQKVTLYGGTGLRQEMPTP